MNKYFIFLLALVFYGTGMIYSQVNAWAGAGPLYTSGFYFLNNRMESYKTTNTGVFLKGIYHISNSVHVSPSFSWILPNIYKINAVDGEEKTSVSSLMFDINGHYVFKSSRHFNFYGLAGLDILIARRKYVSTILNAEQKIVVTDNTPGLNLGAGTLILVSEKVNLFAEIKYLLSKYDQLMVNAGFMLNFQFKGRNKK